MNSFAPFVHGFKTINGFYFYDVNKDTIVSVDEAVFNWLNGDIPYDSLDDHARVRVDRMRAKGLLSDKRVKVLRYIDTKNIHYKLENLVEMLILQVTQSRNLTCSYCPYAYKGDKVSRNHSNKMMSWDIAKNGLFRKRDTTRVKRKVKRKVLAVYGMMDKLYAKHLKKKNMIRIYRDKKAYSDVDHDLYHSMILQNRKPLNEQIKKLKNRFSFVKT